MGDNQQPRDHGGRLDAAVSAYGGARRDWLDLSTGIAPFSYPLPDFETSVWAQLPDAEAFYRLERAARAFWSIPTGVEILAVPGASLAIAQMPRLAPPGRVLISDRTYNEHAAAFANEGWQVRHEGPADAHVIVNPNNPDGTVWFGKPDQKLTIIDESFADAMPEVSVVGQLPDNPQMIVLKSFGKFWGLAGLRLGFVIAHPPVIAKLRHWIGPWAVSGPALRIGAAALSDPGWAETQRTRLGKNATRLDAMMQRSGAMVIGGTPLFRLYQVPSAQDHFDRFARRHILTRTFPYDRHWLRLGIANDSGLTRVEAAL